ncbi:M18 family aminopeptidase [Ilumatobacter sp.]|uniref:M18 family aminopeptidase n=1 Tax=Ilumatobacter sp. TaxID=1967498 RepID=UPI003B516495
MDVTDHDERLGDLIAYLDASPSPWHAVRSTVERLTGSEPLAEDDAWRSVPRRGHAVRDGAIIAWSIPDGATPTGGFRIVGAHTDSPCLRVTPRPDTSTLGWKQLDVEVYGGILNNTWLDRDLGVAGRIVLDDGTEVLVDVGEGIARVPQLAVHLDREVNENGLKLDRQRHLVPVWGIGPSHPGEFAEWIGERAGASGAACWWDLCLYDTQGAAVLGADRSMLASGRLDNLLSCWAATTALEASSASDHPSDHVAVIVLNDHEEVGSASTTGAQGPFLESVLHRLVADLGGSADDVHRAFASSACVSADNAHAVHPNYVERHDPNHRPLVGGGPAIKVNANQRYATSPRTASLFQRACESRNVPWQVFVSASDMPCGSTIGPVTATRLGIETLDVGVPQLSMHSARELCGVADPLHLTTALTAFLT